MHEMGFVVSVLDLAVIYAKENNAQKICAIHVEVGEDLGIIPDLAEKLFHYIARDTAADGAAFLMKQIPSRIICYDCGESSKRPVVDEKQTPCCPKCGSDDIQFLSTGHEWRFEYMEVE